jgi:hypothetical protein
MAQTRKRTIPQVRKRARLHLLIDADVRMRLGAYAGMSGRSQCAIVQEALVEKMKGFYYGVRSGDAPEAAGETVAAPPAPLRIAAGE